MASGKRGETISRGPQRYADSSYSQTHAARRGRGRRLLLGGAAFLTAAAWVVLAYALSLPGVAPSATAVLRPLSAPTLVDRTTAPTPTLDLPSMYAVPVAVAVQFDAT